MKKTRVKLAVVLASVSIAVVAVGGSFAYYTAEREARSAVSAGQLKIRVEITDETGADVRDETFACMPGREEARELRVTNVGREPAWVRVKVYMSIAGKRWRLGGDGYLEGNADIGVGGLDSDDWEYRDGYFYCREVAESAQTTGALFETIRFEKTMDNGYADAKISLDVEACGTQAKHNGETVEEAKGWPEE